jgi:hypothetical protein
MQPEVLRELQERGRFFWEMFPGAKVADEWQRQRDQLERLEETSGEQPVARAADDQIEIVDSL